MPLQLVLWAIQVDLIGQLQARPFGQALRLCGQLWNKMFQAVSDAIMGQVSSPRVLCPDVDKYQTNITFASGSHYVSPPGVVDHF